jgi:Zn-dependent M28 family amino/carboxypeptidase
VTRKGGSPQRRVVFFAHIDSKPGTPGALDNGSSVIVLLLLAGYSGDLGIELIDPNRLGELDRSLYDLVLRLDQCAG